ncbi:MAG: hypothetical protein U0271_19540 [Polyangiaceae bacterium]
MKRTILFAVAACVTSALLAACTGDTIVLPPDDNNDEGGSDAGGAGDGGSVGDTGGSTGTSMPGTSARDYFISTVYPSISGSCGSCHATVGSGAPQFLASNAEGSYTAITSFTPTLIAVPANSNLVLHGEHTGPALDASQDTLVRTWLQMEADERGLVGGGDEPPPAGPTLEEALQMFADCMSYDDWTNYGMNTIASSQTQYGDCHGCHSQGEAGFIANKINDQDMFDRSRDFPFIKRYVSGTVDENGAFDKLVASNRIINKGLEAQSCDPDIDNCHPVFSLPAAKQQAVQNFVDATLQKVEAGGCTAP